MKKEPLGDLQLMLPTLHKNVITINYLQFCIFFSNSFIWIFKKIMWTHIKGKLTVFFILVNRWQFLNKLGSLLHNIENFIFLLVFNKNKGNINTNIETRKKKFHQHFFLLKSMKFLNQNFCFLFYKKKINKKRRKHKTKQQQKLWEEQH